MQVVAQVVVNHELGPHTVLAHHGASISDELIIESTGEHHIGAVAGGGNGDFLTVHGDGNGILAADGIAAVTHAKGGGQVAHGRAGEALGGGVGKVFHLQLVDEGFPGFGIGQRNVFHGCQIQAAVHTELCGNLLEAGGILWLFVPFAIQNVHHFGGSVNGGLPGGIGACPIAAGQVGACAGHPVVQVTVGKLVGNSHAVCTGAVLVAVEILFPLIALAAVTGSGHAVVRGVALGCQHIVQGIVGIIANRQIVASLGENVAARSIIGGGVVAGKQILVNGNSDGFGSAGSQQTGLAIAHNGNGGFFNLVLRLISAIGGLGVQLHHALTGNVTGVGDGHRGGDLVVFHLYAVQLLLEGGIAQTIAEGVLHFIGIVPGAGTGQSAHGAGSAALVHHAVGVTGFVVAVADVNVFRLEGDVFGALVRADGAVDFVNIGKLRRLRTGVDHGRSRQGAGCVGVHNLAGGIDHALQNLGHAGEALVSGIANEQNGIGIVLDFMNLHLIRAVQQDDYLVKVGTHQLQQIPLVFVQGKAADAAGHTALIVHILHDEVSTFRSLPGEDHHGGIAVFLEAIDILLVEGLILLRSGSGTGDGDGHAAKGLLQFATGGGAFLQSAPQSLVYLEALCFQCGFQVDGIEVAVFDLCTGRGALIGRVNGTVTKDGNARFAGKGQSAVLVQQQRCTLAHLVYVLLQGGGNGLCLGFGIVKCAKLALVIGGVVRGRTRLDNPCRVDAKGAVDVARIGGCQGVSEHCNHQKDCKDGGQTRPQFCVFQNISSSFDGLPHLISKIL